VFTSQWYDKRDFWNEVKMLWRHGKTVLVVVDNCKSPDNISTVFAESYAQLCSSVPFEDEGLSQISDPIQNKLKSSNERFIVTRDDVTKTVHQMKAGKCEGNGLFSSDCILNAPNS
jgi:hypothetical protein